jgi:hypothetical protein
MRPESDGTTLRRAVTAAVAGGVSAGGYLAFLGWDRHKTLGADGYLHGPYETWQVVALVLLLAGVAGWSGWRHDQVIGSLIATATVTIAWSIDAATDRENDGLWPVGSFLVAIGTLAGSLLVSGLAWRVTRHRSRR